MCVLLFPNFPSRVLVTEQSLNNSRAEFGTVLFAHAVGCVEGEASELAAVLQFRAAKIFLR